MEIYQRIDQSDHNWYIVFHDPVAGRTDAWTVMRINPTNKRTRIIGRELKINIARKVAKGEI